MSSERFPHPLTRRTFLAASAATAGLCLTACAGSTKRQLPSTGRLRFLGEARLPHRLQFKDTTVGGLSGLDYDPLGDVWYALSDDGSDINPARFYTLRLPVSPRGIGPPDLLDVVTLLQPDSTPYPGRARGGTVPDPESIRFRPQTRTLLWTSDGGIQQGLDPFVREVRSDGTHLREFTLPDLFRADPKGDTGPRHNLTFEGMSLTPDGQSVWVTMEAALKQDGPVPGVATPGGPCRFTLFDVVTGRARQQIAYVPDAIARAPIPPSAFADNGVSEVLMQDEHRMLVLERAYMSGVGNSLRLYQIDTRQGTDTLAVANLTQTTFEPAPKTLIANFADFAGDGLSRLDNTEGMAWGPRLPNGRRTLVFVSDDNFNPQQVTQFLAFEFKEEE
ncbi:esterase-like activity of phytase family protein [soil metagenome]